MSDERDEKSFIIPPERAKIFCIDGQKKIEEKEEEINRWLAENAPYIEIQERKTHLSRSGSTLWVTYPHLFVS